MPASYEGIGPDRGLQIPGEDALEYTMKRCGIQFTGQPGDTTEEFRNMLVEWFFSGSWIRKEVNECEETDDTRRMAG